MTTSPAENPSTEILKTDASGRLRLPREKQEALLDAFEKSGMSGQSFAAWAGVKYPTFASWRQKRRKARSGATTPQVRSAVGFAEAVVAPEPSREGQLVIHLAGGVRVEAGSARAAAEFVRELGRC